ncbi:MAG: haloacid dehalogenase-like hydrolase [Nitrososphaeraceae archaeon]|nr:haloacid dehalogenase-like hydrolase [Nitrososphaeraceae archaeon]
MSLTSLILVTSITIVLGLLLIPGLNINLSNTTPQSIFAQTNYTNTEITNTASNDLLIADPLPSWNNNTVKQNIIKFVENVTNPLDSNNYILSDDRIAVFDNDGTLWAEKPIVFQVYFSMDRIPYIVSKNPSLKDEYPYKQILDKNMTAIHGISEKEAMDLLVKINSNLSEIEFDKLVNNWSQTARNPATKMLFVDMVYQPMLELIDYLKDNQFKVFIVSGGGIDFIRESLSSVYGIPNYQIVGSSSKYKYVDQINSTNAEINNNKSYIFKEPVLNSFDDKYEKPANIALHIGMVPIIAVGNSDGDLQMLKYTDDNNLPKKSLEMIIHHDDPVREFGYEKGAENILEESKQRDWVVVSMENDFNQIYPNNGK